MKIENFVNILNSDFYVGVPDSQLKCLCDYLITQYGIDKNHHIIAANEGNCVAIAAGYNLSTGKVPVVYMQNSGEGNIINPLASLLNEKVYGIPMIFVIGWRGEPGVQDEPQHIYQGEVTLKLLDVMGVKYNIVDKETTIEQLTNVMGEYQNDLKSGKDVAFVVKKGAFSFDKKVTYSNNNEIKREEIIQHIVKYSGEDPIISTTGKASRELFETRENNGESHKYDFLTVGSMGHSSSIALGVALKKPNNKIWCLDGDGAAIMHMGAMAVIGSLKPNNLVHIIVNNEAHESVGGQPTVASKIDITKIAEGCGYPEAISVDNFNDLDHALKHSKTSDHLILIEVKSSIGARENLGRPTTTAMDNKINFMKYLETLF